MAAHSIQGRNSPFECKAEDEGSHSKKGAQTFRDPDEFVVCGYAKCQPHRCTYTVILWACWCCTQSQVQPNSCIECLAGLLHGCSEKA